MRKARPWSLYPHLARMLYNIHRHEVVRAVYPDRFPKFLEHLHILGPEVSSASALSESDFHEIRRIILDMAMRCDKIYDSSSWSSWWPF